ncbi:hypothetical protein LTR59_017320 [Friedmanniomyces endolithicus]|nr:hypothetical protein LTR59_017320 [Friedmanniomyces endolithicus]KAK0769982.1 hypothetical protein LTR38_017722 [Friedmanniomyces endolithicus]
MAGIPSLHTSSQATNLTQTPIPSQSSPTGFSHLDSMMATARAKFAADPSLTSKIRADAIAKLPTALPPTSATLDFNERLDRAITKSSDIIAEAQAQLAAPVSDFLPTELTPAEIAEQKEAKIWTQGYKLAKERNDRLVGDSQELFEDVMGTIDQMQADGIPIPEDCVLPSLPSTPRAETPPMPGAWFADGEMPTRTTSTRREVEDVKLNSLYDGLAIEGCTCSNSLSSRMTRQPQPLPFETTGDFGGMRSTPVIAKRAATRKKTTQAKQVVFDYEFSFVCIAGSSITTEMASRKDNNEDIPCSTLSLPPADTFLMDIFMQDARSKARARMRGLPETPSPTTLREFTEAHDDLEQRINRCTNLACGLLSEAEASLQRPRHAGLEVSLGERPVAAQMGPDSLERGLEAKRAPDSSRDTYEELMDELKAAHARGGSPLVTTTQPPRLRRTSKGSDQLEPDLDEEPSSKRRHVRMRSGSTVEAVSSSVDGNGVWQNIAGMKVKWQCTVQ